MSWDALLMVGFGGPESVAEVLPFLERVTAGRGIPRERLLEVGQHYLTLGGVSPINAQNRALRDALAERLRERGVATELVLANRNSPPFIPDVVADQLARGHTRLLAWSTAAFSSYSGCRQYREDLSLALDQSQVEQVTLAKLPPFPDLPGLLQANAELLAEVLRPLQPASSETLVLVTTHSIPETMAEKAGPHPGPGNQYVSQQHRLAADVVSRASADAGWASPPDWQFVYQSRSGAPHIPWLEPDINDAIEAAADAGVRKIVVLPIGFLTDHVEVIWDLDTQARETAERHDIELHRVATVGQHPAFLDSLAEFLARFLTAEVRTPTPGEFCAGECCANPRGNRPVAPGVILA